LEERMKSLRERLIQEMGLAFVQKLDATFKPVVKGDRDQKEEEALKKEAVRTSRNVIRRRVR
jgi:hypothetical protein